MLNIMLVEDDEVDVMAVQRMLKKNRVINPFYVAANGLEALVMLHERNRQLPGFQENLLILLDFNMPRMNGIEFLSELQLKPDFREIPVVILTAYDEIKTRMETYQLNIAGYLRKPLVFSELAKIVRCDFADSIKSCNFVTRLSIY